jgi:uncharacterized membrane protein YhaH (DUF805 family)
MSESSISLLSNPSDTAPVTTPARGSSFGEAIRTCFSKYATFSGRASRSEYWFFSLFITIVISVGAIIDYAAGSHIPSLLIWLVILLPSFAVQVRRLHDIDRTGWWVLGLVPATGLTPIADLDMSVPYFIVLPIWLVYLLTAVVLVVWACMRGGPTARTAMGPIRLPRPAL